MIPVCLAIGGSDPSGGAGIQADLKTFHRHGVYGAAALALLTVQDTKGVREVLVLPPRFLQDQLQAVLADFPVAAVKTGALGNGENARAVATCLEGWPGFLVVDPVVAPKHGPALADTSTLDGFRPLFGRADLVTPNLDEAALLLGRRICTTQEMESAAAELRVLLGSTAVLLKGGHLGGTQSPDVLADGDGIRLYPSVRLESMHTHGTGCALASAIAAFHARGMELRVAVGEAKNWLTQAIQTAPGLGSGNGPLNLLA
ncbi:MAG TPA: bifunctional hydroxymethylpyrimidine kinase/phosphomethylpyrimidine kinase [Fibrobacteria bacterium]|nr:bifunctional hydroxymethylpyrimidine kinase/phosphomethylpyrimidine kinase [Fibrobacteria bacterium]